jgi:hypothetical protein
MEEKTKKKRVQKRAVRKKTKATEPVAAAVSVAVTTETKKPRKSSKAKSYRSHESLLPMYLRLNKYSCAHTSSPNGGISWDFLEMTATIG